MGSRLVYSPAILRGNIPLGTSSHGANAASSGVLANSSIPLVTAIAKTVSFGSPVDGTVPFGYATASMSSTAPGSVSLTGGSRKGRPTKRCTNTGRHVVVKGRKRVVYRGPRGGEYVKLAGAFVSLSSFTKKK